MIFNDNVLHNVNFTYVHMYLFVIHAFAILIIQKI